MNRPIKFRAWDDAKKEWLCGYEMPNLGGFSLFGETVMLGEWSRILDEYIFERNGHKQDDLKVMQFTGLTDKNGKEIYEGDIVRYRDGIYKVDWFENGFYLFRDVRAKFDIWWVDTEVVGNIYENPELLTTDDSGETN